MCIDCVSIYDLNLPFHLHAPVIFYSLGLIITESAAKLYNQFDCSTQHDLIIDYDSSSWPSVKTLAEQRTLSGHHGVL